MICLGIDPGASGGIAYLTNHTVELTPMPPTEKAIWAYFSKKWRETVAFIEQVQGYIGQGQPGSSMFKFGMNYGNLRMALIAAGIPFYAIPPQEWQRSLGIASKKKDETKSKWKSRLKLEAEKLYPNLNITLATADALLIGHYCKLVSVQRGH